MINGYNFLVWLDLHRQSYFWLAGGLILVALVRVTVPLVRNLPDVRDRHDWGWGLMLLAILLAGRWPTLLVTREINPDESQLLSGAYTLLQDPVFWRAIDGGTAGPLDFFALWPAGWLCDWQGYLPARFTALALLAVTLILMHQGMALVLGRRAARVASLSAACLEALTNSINLLHYSTELLPVTLLSAAFYAAIRRWFFKGGPLWSGLGGLLLGAVPLAKLQAVPLAASAGLCWLLLEFRPATNTAPAGLRPRIYLLAGALIPTVLLACQITAAGEWENVVQSYFVANFQYIAASNLSLWQLVERMLAISIEEDSLLHVWLPGCLIWLAGMLRFRKQTERTLRLFTWVALASSAIALVCVVYSRRPYLHYWQLLIMPLSLLVGATTANLLGPIRQHSPSRDRWVAAAGLLCLIGALLFQRVQKPNTFIGALSYFQKYPRTELSALVAQYGRPGDSLAIWGWSNYVYVETNMRQATRYPYTAGAINPGPFREYYRKRYLADLLHNMPLIFLDSIGPCSLFYQEARFSHDRVYPELAAVIKTYYIQMAEISGARIYLRRTRAN